MSIDYCKPPLRRKRKATLRNSPLDAYILDVVINRALIFFSKIK